MRWRNSLRERSVEETIAIATGLMPLCGIAWVRDITACDRLDIPVAVAFRPRGLTNRWHWGKGHSSLEARLGALMEGIEFAVAENASARGADFLLPMGDLVDLLPADLGIEDFAPRRGIRIAASQWTPAVWCDDLVHGAKALLPEELVLLPCSDAINLSNLYGGSSNGIASGHSLCEASLHALCEVIERDAIAMDAGGETFRVAAGTLPGDVRQRVAAWQRQGIHLTIRSLPSDFGVACFEAVIEEAARPLIGPITGWGCHLERDIALSRAVCEAAQVRLFAIHALSRRRLTSRGTHGDRPWTHVRRIDPARTIISYDETPTYRALSAPEAFEKLVSRLITANIPTLFRFSMHFDEDPAALHGLHVVRIIAPRCEVGVGRYGRIGPRLRQQLRSRWL